MGQHKFMRSPLFDQPMEGGIGAYTAFTVKGDDMVLLINENLMLAHRPEVEFVDGADFEQLLEAANKECPGCGQVFSDNQENEPDPLIELRIRLNGLDGNTPLHELLDRLIEGTELTGHEAVMYQKRAKVMWTYRVPQPNWFALTQVIAKRLYELKNEGLIEQGFWN